MRLPIFHDEASELIDQYAKAFENGVVLGEQPARGSRRRLRPGIYRLPSPTSLRLLQLLPH